MRKKTPREARESSLASGWTVEADESDADAAEPAAAGTDPADAAAVPDAATGVGAAAAGGADETGAAAADVHGDEREQLSNGALVLMGVIGGLYLIYTWVWMTWAQYYSTVNSAAAAGSGSIGGALQQIVFWAAPAAPALWFLCAVLLCRGKPLGRLATALILGAIVLVPVPMLNLTGGAL